jgi:hypothetical protein
VNKRMQTFQTTAALLMMVTALTVLIFSAAGCSGSLLSASLLSSAEGSPNQDLSQPWPTPDPADRIPPAELQAFDNFGTALAYDDNLLAVGAPNIDLEGARNVGAVYLFQKSGNAWQQITRLTPDPPLPDSRFGSAMSIDGGALAVGAPYEYNPGVGNSSGAVYVFTHSKNQWAQAARLTAQDGRPFDLFGSALALKADDLAVGARAADGPSGRDTGAVYLYHREERDWTLQALLGAEAAPFDHFGHALAFAGDELLIGAPDADTAQISNAGMVYIYRQSRGSWTEQGRLIADEVRSQARFGAALYAHGDLLAVVAPQEYQKPSPMPPNAFAYETGFGAAHLFERKGDRWRWQARLFPQPANDQEIVQVSNAVITTIGGRARLALSGYGRAGFFPFEQQDGSWKALPAVYLSEFALIDGQSLAAANGQILLGGRFYDIPGPHGDALQSAGVVWIMDW